jgi:hypothetical protein
MTLMAGFETTASGPVRQGVRPGGSSRPLTHGCRPDFVTLSPMMISMRYAV